MEAIGINLPGLLGQLVNFFLLFALLYAVAYRPILRVLDERSERIRQSIEQAEQIKEMAARAEAEFTERIEQARRESQALVAQATEVGERLREESRAEARRAGEALIERARAEIQLERDEAVAQLRREFADLAVMAAERVIGQTLDRGAHRRLIDEVLAESDRFRLS